MIVIISLFLSLLVLFIYLYLKNTQHFSDNPQLTESSESDISQIIYLIKKQGKDIANMEKISAELDLIVNKILNQP